MDWSKEIWSVLHLCVCFNLPIAITNQVLHFKPTQETKLGFFILNKFSLIIFNPRLKLIMVLVNYGIFDCFKQFLDSYHIYF